MVLAVPPLHMEGTITYMQDQHSSQATATQILAAGQTEPAGFDRGACGSSYLIPAVPLPAWPCFHPPVQLQVPTKTSLPSESRYYG